tara:strand:- start:372 stop:1058 length:687 start_codon:yes stop_codon:yes gene_type:complete
MIGMLQLKDYFNLFPSLHHVIPSVITPWEQWVQKEVILDRKTYLNDEHLYTLSRTDFAKEIGKSREAVKMDMRRGKYKGLYIFSNGEYKFKTREAVREMKGSIPVSVYPPKRKINRGNHEVAVKKGNYPNFAFQQHNHLKKMMALRGKLSQDELALVPEIEAKVKEERRKRLREQHQVNTLGNTRRVNTMYHPNRQSKYGGFMSADELHNAKYRASNYGPDDDFDPIY